MSDRIQIQVMGVLDPKTKSNIQKALERMTKNLRVNVQGNLNGSSGGGLGSLGNLTQVNNQLKQMSSNIQRVNTQLTNASNGMNNLRNRTNETSNASRGFLDNLGKIMKKFADWAIVGTLFYAPLRAFKDGVTFIVQMDTALVDLMKVVDLSKTQMVEMTNAAVELGAKLGKSSVEVMKSFAEFGRLNKSTDDIIKLGEAAVLASNVTTMTADDAAKAINVSMITFKKGVGGAMRIVDSFNEVQNRYRVSAEDMSESITKIGAAAQVAGVSLEQLEGMTGAVTQSTGLMGLTHSSLV